MPPLRLNVGLPLLVGDLLLAGVLEFSPWRSVLLVAAIVLAMWMAFSLRIRPRYAPPPEGEADLPPLNDPDPHAPEPLLPLSEEEQKRLDHEAMRFRPIKKP